MAKSPSNSNANTEIPPGAVSAVNPQAGGIIQLSPEDELLVNQYAQQKGVTQADAVRALLGYSERKAGEERARPTPMERTLGAVQQAQAMGVVSADPNDVVNSMARGVVIKNLSKGLGDGDEERRSGVSMSDLKEMYYLRIMGGMAGIGDTGGGAVNSAVQEMKSENEKLRQEIKDRDEKHEQQIKDMEAKQQADREKSEIDKRFEKLEQAQKDQFDKLMQALNGGTQAGKQSEVDKLIQEMKDKDTRHKDELEKMKSDIRDMVFEKKLTDMERSMVSEKELYRQEVKALSDKVDIIRTIPQPAGTPKDGVSELEELGGKITRIKSALEPIFPHVNPPPVTGSTLPATPATPLKNPDGSTDLYAWAERMGTIFVKGLEAANKEKPPKTSIAGGAQPAQPAQPAYIEKQVSPEEYAEILLREKERTPDQNKWLANYQAYLENEQRKLKAASPPEAQQVAQPVQGTQAVQQQATGCSICGNPVYLDGLCGKCWADINVPVQVAVQQEAPVMTWEQAEAMRAHLLQKPNMTDDETAWMNEYERIRKDVIAPQNAGTANVPASEYVPPVEQPAETGTAVQPVQETQAVAAEGAGQLSEAQPVQAEQTPDVQPVVQPEVQPEIQPGVQAEAPGEVQVGVQAEVPAEAQAVTGQQGEQAAEATQDEKDNVTRMREAEEAKARLLKGFI